MVRIPSSQTYGTIVRCGCVSITYWGVCPSIRRIVQALIHRGYLVTVLQYPNNSLMCVPHYLLPFACIIGDVVLMIVLPNHLRRIKRELFESGYLVTLFKYPHNRLTLVPEYYLPYSFVIGDIYLGSSHPAIGQHWRVITDHSCQQQMAAGVCAVIITLIVG